MQNISIKLDEEGNVYVSLSGLIYLIEYGHLLPDSLITSIGEDEESTDYVYLENDNDYTIVQVGNEEYLSFQDLSFTSTYYLDSDDVEIDPSLFKLPEQNVFKPSQEDISFSETEALIQQLLENYDLSDYNESEPLLLSGENDEFEWKIYLTDDEDTDLSDFIELDDLDVSDDAITELLSLLLGQPDDLDEVIAEPEVYELEDCITFEDLMVEVAAVLKN
ncbi:MAG: hypothetical protein KIG84_02385 [Bacteroidales bacterium]|nr:hypothetical protein [Bacteroidales bacterium]